MEELNIITTTISGSVKDWKKIDVMKEVFLKYYSGKVNVHIVNTHKDARNKANELVRKGKKIIISAGGAGTFNSILEGLYVNNKLSKGIILGFVRKGSADLLGKALKIPDELDGAAKIICDSISKKKMIEACVVEVRTEGTIRHFIGFGGVGVFGDVPHFSESRINKYYKGFLGLFGDRAPFFVAVNLSILKHFLGRAKQFEFVVDRKKIKQQKLLSLIISNGNLGKDFPIGNELALGEKRFKALFIEDKGLFYTFKQLMAIWKGDCVLQSVKSQYVKDKLTVIPKNKKKYMINVDGLALVTNNRSTFSLKDKVKLISG
ncbi:MAG: acylglycerol kinase family protein [bacterium]|nr:acylglycerol kinase family protein [bacterium]